MRVVIDMPEHYYENNIKKELPICLTEDNVIAILPKGHGDLKDVRDIINKINLNYNNHQSIDAYSLKDMIAAVPTIIKADKEDVNDSSTM